ncbi:MAG: virulence RhuM family protein [Bacilli bacterium]|nr:virulence RhuM family protein [Bacilli bacterium]
MNKYEIVKFVDEEVKLDVNISPLEKTIWISIEQMSVLFERDRSVISKHIKNIFLEGELLEDSVCAFFAHTANDGKVYNVKYYNLDVVISVGYRVKSKRGVLFRQWASNIIQDYLIKGYAINEERSLVTNENYVRLINKVESLDERVSNIENNYKPLEFKNSQLFFDGQLYDAYTLIQSLFESANNEIIIIDNYVDRTILDRLVVKKHNVQVIIYTSINTRLLGRDINTFNSQYGGLDVRYTTNVHDRYIIIDRDKLYHLGHSIKDIGKKISTISESDKELIKELLTHLN